MASKQRPTSKPKKLVDYEENKAIERAVLAWLESFPEKPGSVEYGYTDKEAGLAFATIQAAFIVNGPWILGGYRAQYQFEILYRVIAANADDRLTADEYLNTLAAWMMKNTPDPPEGVNWWKVNQTTGAALLTMYENGSEDHTIQMTLIYEVIPNG